jgi:PIN domain nuclease of toxin-antitoxin system
MKALADTHAAIWYLWQPEKLSEAALAVMDASASSGERIGIAAITLCEIIFLVERGRIRSDAFDLLLDAVRAPDGLFEEVPLNSAIASLMRTIPRSAVPEMPDRIIAATALSRNVPLITKDRAITACGIPTVW